MFHPIDYKMNENKILLTVSVTGPMLGSLWYTLVFSNCFLNEWSHWRESWLIFDEVLSFCLIIMEKYLRIHPLYPVLLPFRLPACLPRVCPSTLPCPHSWVVSFANNDGFLVTKLTMGFQGWPWASVTFQFIKIWFGWICMAFRHWYWEMEIEKIKNHVTWKSSWLILHLIVFIYMHKYPWEGD